jgi:hypothetical protein
MGEEGLGFIDTDAMDDAILLRAQARAERLGRFRVRGQDQECLHFIYSAARLKSETIVGVSGVDEGIANPWT